MTITLYDLSSIRPNTTWSPNVWKTRAALNFKGLPYKSVWIEFSDIASVLQKLGASPSGKRKTGADFYTVPVIHDTKTGEYISDSYAIAEYLDKTYPDKPLLFPEGKEKEISEFQDQIHAKFVPPIVPIMMFSVYKILSPQSQAFFRTTREKMFGKKLEELAPEGPVRDGMFEKVKEGLEELGAIYDSKSGKGKPYYFGDDMSYADILLASWILWPKSVLEPKEWDIIASWDDGRWDKFLSSVDNLQKIQ